MEGSLQGVFVTVAILAWLSYTSAGAETCAAAFGEECSRGFWTGDPGAVGDESELLQSGRLTRKGAARPFPGAAVPPFEIRPTSPSGLLMYSEGDVEAFLSALGCIIIGLVVFAGAFCILRIRYPLMYAYNVLQGTSPTIPNETFLSWIWASSGISIEDVVKHTGLDQAMLLEFANLAMKVMALIGVPMVGIFGPMNLVFGGHPIKGDDLTCLSLGNVRNGSPLWWVYAFVVWGVSLIVQRSVYRAQHKFLDKRFAWLRDLTQIRANTVLVEGIPYDYRSDEKLFSFFEAVVSGEGNVARAYVVRDTSTLAPMLKELKDAKAHLREAELMWAKSGQKESERPQMADWPWRAKVDRIDFFQGRVQKLQQEVREERERIARAASAGPSGGVTLSVGFVTFFERAEAELALRLDGMSHDSEEWRLSTPPCPTDVQWEVFQQDSTAKESRELLGYALVVGLYFAYLPMAVGVTNLAKLVHMGPLHAIWRSLAPTSGLQFMVTFLPTFLLSIFTNCFSMKSSTWAQLEMQRWYYWFQLVYVVAATAIGQDVRAFTGALFKDPLSMFSLFASTLPLSTHFFMNYVLVNWVSHSINLTRYMPLLKYLLLTRLYSAEEARDMSEPEDQDYFGMGARSARWSIILTIGLVYGTLSPFVNILVFTNFAICRIFYGYLIPFAETKKVDLGGAFWVTQLKHVFIGNLVYCILMTGIIYQRAATRGPLLVVAASIAYVVWSMRRFDTLYAWERLPFQELMEDAKSAFAKRMLVAAYTQPELVDEETSESIGVPPAARGFTLGCM